jgi:hypothetical protein
LLALPSLPAFAKAKAGKNKRGVVNYCLSPKACLPSRRLMLAKANEGSFWNLWSFDLGMVVNDFMVLGLLKPLKQM